MKPPACAMAVIQAAVAVVVTIDAPGGGVLSLPVEGLDTVMIDTGG